MGAAVSLGGGGGLLFSLELLTAAATLGGEELFLEEEWLPAVADVELLLLLALLELGFLG